MNKEEVKALKKEVQRLQSSIAKSESSVESKKEKIKTLQAEIDDIIKDIEVKNKELAQKEESLKKADYSEALTKLDNAALSKLSKRQAEQLAQHILSGSISSLLGEDTYVAESSKNSESNNPVDTNINGTT